MLAPQKSKKSWASVGDKFGNRDWAEIASIWMQDAVAVQAEDIPKGDLAAELSQQVLVARSVATERMTIEFERQASFGDLVFLRLKARQMHEYAIELLHRGSSSVAVAMAHDAFLFHCRFVMAALGIFVCIDENRYYQVDIFPWMGVPQHTKAFKKDPRWRLSLDWCDGPETPFSQDQLFSAFQRCLRVTTSLPISGARRMALTSMDKRRTSSLRNDSIYQNRTWFFQEDLFAPCLPRDLWDRLTLDASMLKGERAHFHPLVPATIVGSLADALWTELSGSCSCIDAIKVESFGVPSHLPNMQAMAISPA